MSISTSHLTSASLIITQHLISSHLNMLINSANSQIQRACPSNRTGKAVVNQIRKYSHRANPLKVSYDNSSSQQSKYYNITIKRIKFKSTSQHPHPLVVLPDPNRPVVTQLQLLHQQNGSDAHRPTHLEDHLVSLLHIVHQQVLDEVGDREPKE